MGVWPFWERLSSLLFKRRAKLITNPTKTSSTSSTSSTTIVADDKAIRYQVPATQSLLLLHAPRQDYELAIDHPVPIVAADHEIIVRITGIGLNPIDWKAPAFNFAIPELPYISGREFVGEIVQLGGKSPRLKLGDRVLIPSTDYRDKRKAAFQQYAVASDFNAIRLPPSLSSDDASTIGVASVAAVLALGICAGLDFSNVLDGPDLLRKIRRLDEKVLPQDVRRECREGILESDRAKQGDWIAIWGGSSATAVIITQLAQLAGLRVISIVDQAKHGHRVSPTPSADNACVPDIVIDSHNPERVIQVVRDITRGNLRFGIDTRGKDTATFLLQTLSGYKKDNTPTTTNTHSDSSSSSPTPNTATETSTSNPTPSPPASLTAAATTQPPRSHLIGFSGLPKLDPEDPSTSLVSAHSVPIKVFHEISSIGEELVLWLEKLLAQQKLKPPEVVGVEDGLEGVNRGLLKMRQQGGRVVVRI